MGKVIHLNLRVDPTQYIPQIRNVPRYDYIHLVRQPKYMVDLSLLNDKVHYLNEILSPQTFVKEQGVSLLHAHHGQLGLLLIPFKKETNLPLVTSIRGVDATLAENRVGYYENMKMLFEEGEQFFPVCNYLAERIRAWGCPSEKIRVLYGGVDLSQYTYRPPNNSDSLNIISAGRLVEKKGHHIVMQAFDKIRKDYPHASLTVIGSGREEEYIKSLASQLNLGDSFKLIQHVSKDKVREYMSNADLFCAASLESSDGNVEGIPNTIKEAMAIGLPVISTTHAGIPEIITHEQDGILVPENNVEELEQALRDMIENRENWETYTSAARKVVEERFDQEAQLLEQAKYYDELLKGK